MYVSAFSVLFLLYYIDLTPIYYNHYDTSWLLYIHHYDYNNNYNVYDILKYKLMTQTTRGVTTKCTQVIANYIQVIANYIQVIANWIWVIKEQIKTISNTLE